MVRSPTSLGDFSKGKRFKITTEESSGLVTWVNETLEEDDQELRVNTLGELFVTGAELKTFIKACGIGSVKGVKHIREGIGDNFAAAMTRDNMGACLNHLMDNTIVEERPDVDKLIKGNKHEMVATVTAMQHWAVHKAKVEMQSQLGPEDSQCLDSLVQVYLNVWQADEAQLREAIADGQRIKARLEEIGQTKQAELLSNMLQKMTASLGNAEDDEATGEEENSLLSVASNVHDMDTQAIRPPPQTRW